MQKTTKQENIDKLVVHLSKHPDGISTRAMSKQLSCDIKTIQNYISDLKTGYVEDIELVSLKRGYYSVIDKRKALKEAAIEMEKRVYLKLAIETLDELSNLSKHNDELEEELNLEKLSSPYYIKSESYEKLNTDEEEIENLETAIAKDMVISFTFKAKRFHVEPYRLVNFDGIWYLYGKDKEEKENNPYKTWMLKYIDNVEIDLSTKHNMPDDEIDEDLDKAHSAQFVPDKYFDVKLKVSAKVADLFRQKNHLPNQNSTIQDDGSLLVISTISTYADIDPEVKSWLPHIQILEPKEYRDSFKEELMGYIKDYGDI